MRVPNDGITAMPLSKAAQRGGTGPFHAGWARDCRLSPLSPGERGFLSLQRETALRGGRMRRDGDGAKWTRSPTRAGERPDVPACGHRGLPPRYGRHVLAELGVWRATATQTNAFIPGRAPGAVGRGRPGLAPPSTARTANPARRMTRRRRCPTAPAASSGLRARRRPGRRPGRGARPRRCAARLIVKNYVIEIIMVFLQYVGLTQS